MINTLLSSAELTCIFLEVPLVNVMRALPRVCKKWRHIIKSERFWKRLGVHYELALPSNEFITKVCAIFGSGNHTELFRQDCVQKIIKKTVEDLHHQFIDGNNDFPFARPQITDVLVEKFLPLRKTLPPSILAEYPIGYVRPMLLKMFEHDIDTTDFDISKIKIKQTATELFDLVDESLINVDQFVEYINSDPGFIYHFEHFVFTNKPLTYKLPKALGLWMNCCKQSPNLILNCDECTKAYTRLFINEHPLLKIHYQLYDSELYQNMEPIKNIYEWIPFYTRKNHIHHSDHSQLIQFYTNDMLMINANPESPYFEWILLWTDVPDFNVRIVARSFTEMIKNLDPDSTKDLWAQLIDYYETTFIQRPIFLGTACDHCQQYPMTDERYHCLENCNFDLCGVCKNAQAQAHKHELVLHPNDNGARSYFNRNEIEVVN